MNDIKKHQIAVLDYEMGNLFSVQRACEIVGLEPIVTSDPKTIMNFSGLILPGVGAFGDAMKNLEKFNLVDTIKAFINSGKPFMGICLGMQLLMSESEEFGSHKGLDIIKGSVKKFPTVNSKGKNVKVPHVGWEQIFKPSRSDDNIWKNTPLENTENGEYMYLVHSYYVVPSNSENILSVTTYDETTYCSSINYKNVFASQFHPEKSAKEGLKIYENWAKTIMKERGNQ